MAIRTATVARASPPSEPAPEPESQPDEIDAAYLDRRLVTLLGRGPQSAEDAAEAIDAPVEAVKAACDRLTDGGAISLMTDGRWVA